MIENIYMMIVPVSARRGETVEYVMKKNNKNVRNIVRVRYDKDSNSGLL